jgi:N-methylhydantoinase A
VSYRIGIDVGGTFTDFLVLGSDGQRIVHKTSSTPADPSVGVGTGLAEIAALLGSELAAFLADTEAIVHGTTVTTNAVLTRRGAATGLLATKGFRDALALRNGLREEPYDNRLQPPVPLVPRSLRLGIEGRIDWSGAEVDALSLGDVRDACERFRRQGVEAVAISFMHSPANGEHERRARDLCRELLP